MLLHWQDTFKLSCLKTLDVKLHQDQMQLDLPQTIPRNPQDFTLELTDSLNFKSAYAAVYRELYKQNPKNKESLVTDSISKLQEMEATQSDLGKLTFEYSLSHFSHEFNSNVDYIW